MRNKTLYAFFDLAVSPICFDFYKFLVLAELRRIELTLDIIHILIVPCEAGKFPFGGDWSNHDWRLRNIAIGGIPTMRSVRGVTTCSDRDDAKWWVGHAEENIFPNNYDAVTKLPWIDWADVVVESLKGKNLPIIEPSLAAKKLVAEWFEDNASEKVVTITLREMSGDTVLRNSDLDGWFKFAETIERDGYKPVILRDFDRIFDSSDRRWDRFSQFNLAAIDPDIRIALYNASYINMFVANGPFELATFSPSSVHICFFILPDPNRVGEWQSDVKEAAIDKFVKKMPTGSGPFQRLIWQLDTFENIYSVYGEFVEELKQQPNLVEEWNAKTEFPPTDLPVYRALDMFLASNRQPHVEELKSHFSIKDANIYILEMTINSGLVDRQEFTNMGTLALRRGDLKISIEYFKRALEFDGPLLIPAVIGLVSANIGLGQLQETESLLQMLWDQGSRHPKLVSTLCDLLRSRGALLEVQKIEIAMLIEEKEK